MFGGSYSIYTSFGIFQMKTTLEYSKKRGTGERKIHVFVLKK